MNRNFFSKENYHNAIWALLIAFISFLGGSLFKVFSGPERIIIDRDKSKLGFDTAYTIIRIEGDSSLLSYYKNNISGKIIKSNDYESSNNFAKIARPAFELPVKFKGYTSTTDLNSYASVQISRHTFTQNENIDIQFNLLNKDYLHKISPVFVTLLKYKSYYYEFIWEEQYKFENTNNSIRFNSNFKKGEYTLEVGFFIMDEINKVYPPKHSQSFIINII